MLWIFPCEVFVYKHFFFYYVFTINCSLGEKFPISVRRRSAPLFRFGLFFHLHPEMPVTFMCLYASAFNLFLLTERWIHSWNVVFLNRNLRPMLAAFTHDHAAVSTHEVKPQRRHAELRELGLPRLTGNDPCVSRGQGTKGSGDKTELLRDWGSSPGAERWGLSAPTPPPPAVSGSDSGGLSSASCLSEAWASLPHGSMFARVCFLLLPRQPLQGWMLCLWSSWVVSGKKSFIWFFYIYAWKLSSAKWWGTYFHRC